MLIIFMFTSKKSVYSLVKASYNAISIECVVIDRTNKKIMLEIINVTKIVTSIFIQKSKNYHSFPY